MISVEEFRKMKPPTKKKYGNVVFEYEGEKFDSRREMRRYFTLHHWEKTGVISGLKRQVKYELIPAQYRRVEGKTKCVERACSYIADFSYLKDDELILEDSKGFRTKDYIIKKKLMLHVHGIQIKEV